MGFTGNSFSAVHLLKQVGSGLVTLAGAVDGIFAARRRKGCQNCLPFEEQFLRKYSRCARKRPDLEPKKKPLPNKSGKGLLIRSFASDERTGRHRGLGRVEWT